MADSAAFTPADAEIITVRPQHDTATLQKLPYFVGISGSTAGSQSISMNLVIIPPGASAEPHFHKDYETAIYILQGRVKTAAILSMAIQLVLGGISSSSPSIMKVSR